MSNIIRCADNKKAVAKVKALTIRSTYAVIVNGVQVAIHTTRKKAQKTADEYNELLSTGRMKELVHRRKCLRNTQSMA